MYRNGIQLLIILLNVCYTGLLNRIFPHCHYIIENYCLNLELLAINYQSKLDGQDVLKIAINVT